MVSIPPYTHKFDLIEATAADVLAGTDSTKIVTPSAISAIRPPDYDTFALAAAASINAVVQAVRTNGAGAYLKMQSDGTIVRGRAPVGVAGAIASVTETTL
jgi:hypothetical protein